MQEKRIEKLLRLTIQKQELQALLNGFGFVQKHAKGSHEKWEKAGVPTIVLSSHHKEVKRYQIKKVIEVLKIFGFLEGNDEKTKKI